MPPSEKDIAQVFQRDYIIPNLTSEELIRRLKKLSNVLSETEQLEEESEARATVKPVAQNLVKPALMKHASREIRLLVACCLADILRILAPETD